MAKRLHANILIGTLLASVALVSGCHKKDAGAAAASGDSVKVGVLHSLTGTMAISEVTVKNSTQMAIDEINAAGGVMGKPGRTPSPRTARPIPRPSRRRHRS
jgi:urea transport system substrate-binding protein